MERLWRVVGIIDVEVRGCSIGRRLVLVMVEEQLDSFVLLAAVECNVGSQVRHEALALLAGGSSDTLRELCCITCKPITARVCPLKAFLSSLVVLLKKLEHGFIRVEKHLVLLNIYVLWVNTVLAQKRPYHYAEAVLTHYIFLNAFYAGQTILCQRTRFCFFTSSAFRGSSISSCACTTTLLA